MYGLRNSRRASILAPGCGNLCLKLTIERLSMQTGTPTMHVSRLIAIDIAITATGVWLKQLSGKQTAEMYRNCRTPDMQSSFFNCTRAVANLY